MFFQGYSNKLQFNILVYIEVIHTSNRMFWTL